MSSAFADLFRAAIFAAAHLLGGSLGAGVLTISFAVRLALMPLTIRLARRTLAQQAILVRLQPELRRLKTRFSNDPVTLWRRTHALYRREGYRPLDPAAMLGTLVQLPVLAGVYAAVRQGLGAAGGFLWVANLLRPDVWLAIGVAGLSALATYITARSGVAQPSRSLTHGVVLSAGLVFFFAWRASAIVVLSWGAGTLGTLVQGIVLGRDRVRRGAVSQAHEAGGAGFLR